MKLAEHGDDSIISKGVANCAHYQHIYNRSYFTNSDIKIDQVSKDIRF